MDRYFILSVGTKRGDVSSREAAELILDPDAPIAAIVIDPFARDPLGIELLPLARRHRPVTPIYLEGTREAFVPAELRRLGVQGVLDAANAMASVRAELDPAIFEFEARLEADAEPDSGSDPGPYVPVRASDFLTGLPSQFDVYLKMPLGRYLRVVESLAVFPSERARQYLDKGVRHFYIRRESLERSVGHCERAIKTLLRNPSASLELKFARTFGEGEGVFTLIRQAGLSSAQLEHADGFLRNVRLMLRQAGATEERGLHLLLAETPAHHHAVGVTMVASLLALPLKIESGPALRTLGLAAFLHDIGLYSLPARYHDEDTLLMTQDELEVFATHPRLGQEILAQFPAIDPLVGQVIGQHHEHAREGYEIQPLAEVIGISECFVRLISRLGIARKEACLKEMREKHLDRFSYPVINAFCQIFMPSYLKGLSLRNQRTLISPKIPSKPTKPSV